MTLPLSTRRLTLRRVRADDVDALAAVFGDPDVMRYVGTRRVSMTRAEVGEALDRAAAHWREHGFGPLAVVERADGAVVGECGLQTLEGGPDVEPTYTLARASWGRGYAGEAAAAVLEWGFAELALERIVAVTYPANAASRRVLQKAGLRHVGVRRCYGADLDEFVLHATDWTARSDSPEA